MGGGLLVGLWHRDAARFTFLLAAPIILAAGALKLPELAGPGRRRRARPGRRRGGLLGRDPVPGGALPHGWFETRTLTPLAGYCAAAGAAAAVFLAVS